MPLIKSHKDEDREKNIEEMIKSGHDPKQAVAAGYANQRKYKKMAEGGMVEDSDMNDEYENEIDDSHRGLYELQEDSHINGLDEVSEEDKMIASALSKKDDVNGKSDSDIDEEETVNMPESHFAAEAKRLVEERKKKKAIIA